ncbi:MAG TPA: O-antigen ligase family protein [Vicinamibacterales bacterium]|nr:O-antigen ligase family protein [Vicinamibacterales bacterium]
MIQAARILVIVSTVLAAFVEGYLAAEVPHPPEILWVGAGGFLLMMAVGQRWRSVAMPLLMASLYLTPAILYLAINAVDYSLDAIWILPLVGLILSDRGALQWSLPVRWQWPLITWAAMVSLTWPIVFLRELDFAPWILPLQRVSNSSDGAPPWLTVQNVAYFALLHNVGILLVDALCRWYRDDTNRFRREVIIPLLSAAGIAAAVSAYQGFVDLKFLNTHFWAYMLRASGTLADANKLGAVAGFWTVGAIVFARRVRQPWSVAITVASLVLGFSAAWLSGSRTGLASVLLSTMIAGVEALRWLKLDVRKLAYAGGGALIVGALMVVVLQNASTHTVVQRGTLGYIPFLGDRGIAQSADELLWDRFGYGPAAIQMIREHPLSGVGLGIYHSQSHDFGQLAGRTVPQPDNAQAWWRHNLAELGLLGCIPLIAWCVIFGRTLFTRGPAEGDRLAAGMLRGLLIAFFVASLFGLPSQSAAITMTFWVFVFWFLVERGGDSDGAPAIANARLVAGVIVALVATHTIITTVDAFGNLRPRHRAERIGWYYRYGYHISNDGADVEADPGGNPIGRRWTMKKSLAVIPVRGNVLKFVAWVDHPDADANPVHTQVYADSMLVYEGDLRRTPLFIDIPATPGKRYMTIETSVDRTFRPSDAGSRDGRDLGLSIRDWNWE